MLYSIQLIVTNLYTYIYIYIYIYIAIRNYIPCTIP